LIARNS